MRMKIGFLGLGIMGTPLANNLRKAGFQVTVWNRSPEKAELLVKKGVALAHTPRACAEGQDLVFTCLSDEEALAQVIDGPDGVLAALKPGDTLVDATTAGVRATKELRDEVTGKGASFLAAPLLGSKVAAEKAQLVVIAGGPAEVREKARPALHAVSARIIDLDDAVGAALMKICVNSVGGAMIAAFGEALALGAAGGLPLDRIIETLQASAFHSPLYLMKGEQILAQDYEARFALSLAEKDERLAQEAAQDHGVQLPMADAVRKVFGEAIAAGHGEKDNAAVAEVFFAQAKIRR